MIYLFKSGIEEAKVLVDKNKELFIATRKTQHQFKPITEIINIDSRTALKLSLLIKLMSQKEIDEYLINEFKEMKYTLERIYNE